MKTKLLLLTLVLFSSVIASAANFAKDVFKTKEGKTLEITFIKHGSLMLKYNNKIIQVDPVSSYADYKQFPKADLILVTHEHGDHLDMKAIAASRKSGTKIIANENSVKKMSEGKAMKNGESTNVFNIKIDAVPAYNMTEGHTQFHPKGRDNCYILTFGGTRVYISGDTEDIPELKNLKNITIAFLPVNQPYTMTVPQAARAAKMFMPKILYPYHYGETKIEALKTALNGSGIDVRIRNLQ
jgi:L-ascorbate metabolism protein UlaG (beta-lactamase superfamily)